MADKDTHEPRNEQTAAERRPPVDRSYGESASDHADPKAGPDRQHPDTGAVQRGYDATAESTATARNPRTPSALPQADDPG